MTRKKLMAGNWKMFKTNAETRAFFGAFTAGLAPLNNREAAIGVPATALEAAAVAVGQAPVMIAAQNIHWQEEGAFTGEISAPMVAATGAKMAIIGHSERRQFFGDTDEWVNKKIGAALKHKLIPVMCVGESLAEREGGQAFKVLETQLAGGLKGFSAADLGTLVIAYEPVWAIGTGKTATPEQAQEVHAFIRKWVKDHVDAGLADGLRILYGGSVKPDNVAQLMGQPDIDGALVGGASLDPASFLKIVNY